MPEGSFDRWRARVGLVAAPLACLALWLAPMGVLSLPAHRLRAILALVVILWITEAVPLPVTALLGPALCVVAGVGPAREVFRSFGDPVIFVFLGSFLLADAMVVHGLNRRVAFGILGLRAIGERPGRLLAAFGAITALISMWVSNTATTAMMFPIALAILREMARLRAEQVGEAVGPCSEPLRRRVDADRRLRVVRRRARNAGRHAAQPHRHRAHPEDPGRRDSVLPLDGVRGAAHGGARRLPDRVPQRLVSGGGVVAVRKRRVDPLREGSARPFAPGRTQHARRLLRDGGPVGASGCHGPRRGRRSASVRLAQPARARVGRRAPRRGPPVRAPRGPQAVSSSRSTGRPPSASTGAPFCSSEAGSRSES